MTLLLLAAALLVLPASPARRRLRALTGGSRGPVRRRLGRGGTAGAAALGLAAGVLLGGVLPGVALAMAAALGRHRWAARRGARRDAALVGSLVAGLDVVVAELRVGAHPASACAAAAGEVDGPVARVLGEAAARSRLGGSAADGLAGTGSAALDGELARVAAAWRVADERGVALAELLDAVRTDVVGRVAFRSRTEAGLAGPRATAAVLAALPLLGIGLGEAIGAAPLDLLLHGTLGGALLVVGTALVCAGLLWTARITAAVAR